MRTIGMILFVPSLLILGLLTNFQTEVLAALLRTVAGNILSNKIDDRNDKNEEE